MKSYRYILEPYNGATTRHHCPKCSVKQHSFTRYIDLETSQYLDDTVGKCNREDNCGYHLKPKEYFSNLGITTCRTTYITKNVITETKPASYIDTGLVSRSLSQYESNNFIKFLENRFETKTVTEVIERYLIGTSKRWNGASIFWQCDINKNFRTGKIMLYDPSTCKRISSEERNTINWVHTSVDKTNFNLKQCLFGEHLLRNNTKPIALVESEKNAVIASIYFPQFLWLATGSKNNLNVEKCKVLKGLRVVLFPDFGAFNDWNVKATELGFEIDSFIEQYAISNNEKNGFDIADYLLSRTT